MKKNNYIKTFESFKKINEGGGSGIEFITSCTLEAEYLITNETVEKVKFEIAMGDSFDALGYDDGMRNVRGDLMKVEAKNELPTIEEFKAIKLDFLRCNMSDFLADNNLEVEDEDSIKTIGDLFNINPELTLRLNFDLHYDCKEMRFAGYVRGTFEVDDLIFEKPEINGDYSQVYVDNETIEDVDCINFNIYITATEEFVNFYKDVFVNGPDGDNEDDYESYRDDLQANYGA